MLLSVVIRCYLLLSVGICCYLLLSVSIYCYQLLFVVIRCYVLLSVVICCYLDNNKFTTHYRPKNLVSYFYATAALRPCSYGEFSLHGPRANGFSHKPSHDRVSAVWKFACKTKFSHSHTNYLQVFPPCHKMIPGVGPFEFKVEGRSKTAGTAEGWWDQNGHRVQQQRKSKINEFTMSDGIE